MEDKPKKEAGVTIQSFQNNLYLESAFSYSERSVFVYKKTEKLVVAANLVAGLIKDNSHLSDAFRVKTLELLSVVSKSLLVKAVTSSGDRYQASVRALSLIAEITSLCEVAHYAKHMSEMNATLLKREFASLYKMISEEIVEVSESGEYLTRDFFTEAEPAFHKGHDKGHNMSFTKTFHQAAGVGTHPQHSLGGVTMASTNRVGGGTNKAHGNTLSSAARTDRRTLIMKVIKEKGEVGVADVTGGIKGVGEKTIQRELLAMVSEGILKKQGERRWSRYSII